MDATGSPDTKRLGERFDPFHNPYLADPYLWCAKSSLPSLHCARLQRLAGRQWKFDLFTSGFVDDE